MNLFCLSISEIQRFRLSFRMKDLSNIFELSEMDLYGYFRELKILSPTQYVRTLNREELAVKVVTLGIEIVARNYLVSPAFIKSLYEKPKLPPEEKLSLDL